MTKPLIYVCGPYSAEDVVTNTRDACFVGNALLNIGATPIVPHLSLFWQAISPKPYQEWLDYDFDLLDRCDALYRFDNGRPSPGADAEVAFMLSQGKPVFIGSDNPLNNPVWVHVLHFVSTWAS